MKATTFTNNAQPNGFALTCRAMDCHIRVQQTQVEGCHAILTVDENRKVSLIEHTLSAF